MSNEPDFHAEPIAPTIGFMTHAGSRQGGRTNDYAAWQKDLDERQERTRNFIARQQAARQPQDIDLIAELDQALNALHDADQDFSASYGKPNQPLIDSKLEVERLKAELIAAESRLADIENRGDSVKRLQGAVMHAEGAFMGLLRASEEKVIRKLVTKHFRLGSFNAQSASRTNQGNRARHICSRTSPVRNPTATAAN